MKMGAGVGSGKGEGKKELQPVEDVALYMDFFGI